MLLRLSVLFMATLFATTGCKKEKGEAPKTDPAAKPADPTADKPADKTTDKPADMAGSDKPADKPADGSAAVAPAAPAEIKWEKYTSKEGGYTVEFPGKAEEKDMGNGMMMAGSMFGTTATDDRTAMCGVAYMKLPPDVKMDAKTFLDNSSAGHKKDPSAKVIEEKDVKVGKHPGRHLIIENSSHRKWMRTYFVDKTVYVVNCGGPFDRAKADEPVAKKVLESFALAK